MGWAVESIAPTAMDEILLKDKSCAAQRTSVQCSLLKKTNTLLLHAAQKKVLFINQLEYF
jgi:hypothetical protein